MIDDYGTDSERRQQAINFRNKINNISPSFCAAKWKQVTVHLHNGHTHSCHHPVPHLIPLNEVLKDSSALHNTKFKQEQQQLMLQGKRPAECDYCWKVEDSDPTGSVFSDRIMKSIDSWASPYIDEIVDNPNKKHNPSYLEVSFSSVCNFKCSYCSPEVSSKWMEEIKEHGSYPTSKNLHDLNWLKQTNKIPYLEKDENPYVDAFWEWWPEIYSTLKILRVTGGEPLLTKHTFRMMEYILKNPRPDLELNINSNLVIPEKLFLKFISLARDIQLSGAVKSFKVYTSCEAKGEKAEYIRHGLNYSQWLENCHTLMQEIPHCKISVMSTYNALSVTSFGDFLKDMLDFRLQYTNAVDRHPIGLDIPYLRWPTHQTIEILPDSYRVMIEAQLKFMQENMQETYDPDRCGRGFYDYEINRMSRVLAVFDNRKTNIIDQKDFGVFVDEHDRRRGTNFLKTFPEMEKFYSYCKTL
jgi:organic radical activating enzyme